MTHQPSSLVRANILLTGPVRPRTMGDRRHVAAMLRARRAIREVPHPTVKG
jgi:hypothetical protein